MKEASSVSPFALLTGAKQKEQWICWQCQQQTGVQRRPIAGEPAPELPQLHLPQAAAPAPMMPPRHSQYDAVLRRNREAARKAGAFQPWQQV